jgi:hypothetical protein
MKFKMKKTHALTQAALEQRIVVFCEIVNFDFFCTCLHWNVGKGVINNWLKDTKYGNRELSPMLTVEEENPGNEPTQLLGSMVGRPELVGRRVSQVN